MALPFMSLLTAVHYNPLTRHDVVWVIGSTVKCINRHIH